MITTLTATTTSRIVSRLVEHEGTSGSSRVLSLVISTDEKGLEDALCAAHGASRDHPSRIIAVVDEPDAGDDLGDLLGLGVDDMWINTDPSTAENLAGKFQQNTMIRG